MRRRPIIWGGFLIGHGRLRRRSTGQNNPTESDWGPSFFPPITGIMNLWPGTHKCRYVLKRDAS